MHFHCSTQVRMRLSSVVFSQSGRSFRSVLNSFVPIDPLEEILKIDIIYRINLP